MFGWRWWWWWWWWWWCWRWRWQWWWRGLGIAYWWKWVDPDGNWVEKWEEWPKCGSHSTVWQDQAHSVVRCPTMVYTLTQCQCSQVTQATLTVLKLKGDPLQYFLAKLMQLYSFGTNLNLNLLFSPFSLGVLLLLSSFLDSHFPEFRRQFFAFSWFLSPTSTEQSRHLKSQLSHLFSSFLLRVVQIQTSAVNDPSKGLPPPTRPDYPN